MENKIKIVNCICGCCNEPFTIIAEFYLDEFLNLWRPVDALELHTCPKCKKAYQIMDEKRQKDWIKYRDILLKNKDAKGVKHEK